MLRIMEITDETTHSIERIVPQCWIHAVGPTASELAQLHEAGIPSELLSHVLDPGERTRVVRRGDIVLIVIHLPYELGKPSNVPYATAPVSLILQPRLFVTIEPQEIGLFEKLSANPPTGLKAHDKTKFVLGVLLQAASDYVTYLRDINLAVDEAEDRLQRSLRNQEVLQLLNFQKSLVFFSTALNSIEMMVEKLRKGDFLEWSSDDLELAEDALIEIRQAVYQVDIAQNILTQMMDAFASIVSNNLNTVMKFLAAITIIISIPMLIASVYGMNVPLPGGLNYQTFGYLIVTSVLLSVLVVILFRRKDWL
jgi:magnesium transporter